MEHLLYVMWHDHWKPWLKDKLEWAGYIGLGILITGVIFFGLILLEIEVSRILDGLYK